MADDLADILRERALAGFALKKLQVEAFRQFKQPEIDCIRPSVPSLDVVWDGYATDSTDAMYMDEEDTEYWTSDESGEGADESEQELGGRSEDDDATGGEGVENQSRTGLSPYHLVLKYKRRLDIHFGSTFR